MTANLFILFV